MTIKETETVDLLRRLLSLFRAYGVHEHARMLVLPEGLRPFPDSLASIRYPIDFGATSCMNAYVSAMCLLRWITKSARLDAEEQAALQVVLDDINLRNGLQRFLEDAPEFDDPGSIVRCADDHEDTCVLLANSLSRIFPEA